MSNLKSFVKQSIPQSLLSRALPLYHKIRAIIYKDNLNVLAELYGTDKWGWHYYTQHYMPLFAPFRKKKIKLLEIGIGGYEDPGKGGESLKMWSAYFTGALIYAIDIYDKSYHETNRIKTFKGSQSDPAFLKQVMDQMGTVDIIIDDGSHRPADQLASFKFLFPYLKKGGFYIVEDTSGSYSSSWGGSEDLAAPFTFLNYAKSLTDNVNYIHLVDNASFKNAGSVLRNEIEVISFYTDLVIIKKA